MELSMKRIEALVVDQDPKYMRNTLSGSKKDPFRDVPNSSKLRKNDEAEVNYKEALVKAKAVAVVPVRLRAVVLVKLRHRCPFHPQRRLPTSASTTRSAWLKNSRDASAHVPFPIRITKARIYLGRKTFTSG